MDNLISIWNQLNNTVDQLELIVKQEEIHSVFDKLKKEEELRKKYNPLLIAVIICTTFALTYVVYANSSTFNVSKIIGLVCVALASISIATFSQIVKMPLSQFEHDQASTTFLKIVKEKLDKAKSMLILGIVLQVTFLALGLYFLIFFNNVSSHSSSYLFAFFGSMLGLGGFAIGSSISFFNKHYKEAYRVINLFINS